MQIKYNSSYYDDLGNRIRFAGTSKDVFEKCAGKPNWNNEVYFYPSDNEESVWLWVLGHERAWEKKHLEKIVFMNRLVIHFCLGGKGYYNGRPIERGSCFITWPYLPCSLRADPEDPMEFCWIIFRGDNLETFAQDLGLSANELIFNIEGVDGIASLIDLAICEDFSHINAHDYTLALSKMILAHKRTVGKNEDSGDEAKYSRNYVKTAKNIMDRFEYSISINELASMLGLTPKHFSRVFHNMTGEHPKEYMTRKRMNIAAELLDTGIPPNEVAIMLKYSDYASFYRAFFKSYSCSPKDFVMKK